VSPGFKYPYVPTSDSGAVYCTRLDIQHISRKAFGGGTVLCSIVLRVGWINYTKLGEETGTSPAFDLFSDVLLRLESIEPRKLF